MTSKLLVVGVPKESNKAELIKGIMTEAGKEVLIVEPSIRAGKSLGAELGVPAVTLSMEPCEVERILSEFSSGQTNFIITPQALASGVRVNPALTIVSDAETIGIVEAHYLLRLIANKTAGRKEPSQVVYLVPEEMKERFSQDLIKNIEGFSKVTSDGMAAADNTAPSMLAISQESDAGKKGTMTRDELLEFLKKAIPAKSPVLIEAAPGRGVSALILQAAKSVGAQLIHERPYMEDPLYHEGIFSEDLGCFVSSNTWQIINAGTLAVCLVHDLGQASEKVQSQYYTMMSTRMLNGERVSDNVCFIATGVAAPASAHRAGLGNRFMAIELE